ncbi:MAG TPA: PAS domain S-box protein [Candidatus Acidoferrum sp.]|nr:PAS domain S-box protein [Candidatus Acidoferrum sp.]
MTSKERKKRRESAAKKVEDTPQEKALREGRENFEALAENAFDGILVATGQEGSTVYANKRAAQITGYSIQELLRTTIKDLARPDEFQKISQRFRSRLRGEGAPTRYETVIIRKDGTSLPVELAATRTLWKRKPADMVLLRDITEHKRIEEELRESEERYRLLFEKSAVGIGLATASGTPISANKTMLEVTGYSLEELRKVNLADTYADPQTRKKLSQILDREDSVTNFPARLKRKDGTVYDTLLSVSRLHVGGKDMVQTTCVDITQQKQMEEELRQRAQELDSLQETLLEITGRHELSKLLNGIVEKAAKLLRAPGGGLYLCDPDRQEARCVVAYNTKVNTVGFALKYGEGAAGVVAQTGKPLIIDDYRTWSSRAAVYEKDKPFGAVLSAPMIWQNEVIGVIHVLRYDTERFTETDLKLLTVFANHAAIAVENARLLEQVQQHAAELEELVDERTKEIHESESRYRRLFESSPVSLWEEDFSEVKSYFDDLRSRGVKDLRRHFTERPEELDKCTSMVKILDVNEATLSLYGAKSVVELRGELRRVLSQESLVQFREELVALSDGETRFASEFDNQTLAGDTKHVGLILNVVPGYEDTLAKVLVSIIDFTERKKMEERLLRSQRLAAIGETAMMVAHDLRNPLQGIAGATYLLQQDSLSARETTELLQLVQDNIEYSDAIVRDLLDYSTEIHLTLAETTPSSITRQAIQTIKIPEKIAVQDSSEDHVKLRADLDRMRRVFVNVIENAIDAMPQGGTLMVSSKQLDGSVEIAVSDTGSGMPEKVLQNLWRPLQTTKAKGLGLGLAICKRIVDAHGGTISVSSRTGEGTTVTVRLPIKPVAVEVTQK